MSIRPKPIMLTTPIMLNGQIIGESYSDTTTTTSRRDPVRLIKAVYRNNELLAYQCEFCGARRPSRTSALDHATACQVGDDDPAIAATDPAGYAEYVGRI